MAAERNTQAGIAGGWDAWGRPEEAGRASGWGEESPCPRSKAKLATNRPNLWLVPFLTDYWTASGIIAYGSRLFKKGKSYGYTRRRVQSSYTSRILAMRLRSNCSHQSCLDRNQRPQISVFSSHCGIGAFCTYLIESWVLSHLYVWFLESS